MCSRLYLASPLTLSEIRSMLPSGMTADLLPTGLRDGMLDHLPEARDAVVLARGECACDLAGRRLPDREDDERRLRARYRALGVSRPRVIRAIDAHRRQPRRPVVPPGHWPRALAGFVAEHARNAGPALYLLRFTAAPEEPPVWPDGRDRSLTAAQVRADPAGWLDEDTPTTVVP